VIKLQDGKWANVATLPINRRLQTCHWQCTRFCLSFYRSRHWRCRRFTGKLFTGSILKARPICNTQI